MVHLSIAQIVEAMPQTQVVGDFVDTLGTFYEMVDEEPPMELNLHKNKRNGENNNPEQDLEDGIFFLSFL